MFRSGSDNSSFMCVGIGDGCVCACGGRFTVMCVGIGGGWVSACGGRFTVMCVSVRLEVVLR
jgi:hypothetical protein